MTSPATVRVPLEPYAVAIDERFPSDDLYRLILDAVGKVWAEAIWAGAHQIEATR